MPISVVGTGYVTIRPDFSTFDAEAEAKIKESALQLQTAAADPFTSAGRRTGESMGVAVGDGIEAGAANAGSVLERAGKDVEDKSSGIAASVRNIFMQSGASLGAWGLPFGEAVAKMGEKVGEAELQQKSLIDSLGEVGRVAVVGAAAGLAVVAGEAIHLGITQQTVNAQLAANAGITVAAATAIGNAFLDTGGKVAWSGTAIEKAYVPVAAQLGQVEGHTLSAADAMQVMNAAMDLAEGTGESLGSTTQDLAKVMQAYGISTAGAAGAADQMFQSARLSGNGLDSLAQTVQRMHSQLGALTPPLAESGALLIDLADHGETGRRAMTAMSTALTTLLKPTETLTGDQQALNNSIRDLPAGLQALAKEYLSGAMTSTELTKATKGMTTSQTDLWKQFTTSAAAVDKAKLSIQNMGITVTDAQGKIEPLANIIGQLHDKIQGETQAQQLATLTTAVGAASARALLGVIQAGPAAFDQATAAVNRTAAAHDAADKMSKTLGRELEVLASAGEDLATKLGLVLIPWITKLSGVLAEGVGWLTKHRDAALAVAGVIGGVLTSTIAIFVAKTLWGMTKGIADAVDGLGKLVSKAAGLVMPNLSRPGIGTSMSGTISGASGEIAGMDGSLAGASGTADATTGSIDTLAASIDNLIRTMGIASGDTATWMASLGLADIEVDGTAGSLDVLSASMGAFNIALADSAASLQVLDGALAEADVAADANPIGLIILAVAALGVGIYELVTHWHQVWGDIKTVALDAWHYLDGIFHDIAGTQAFKDVEKVFKTVFADVEKDASSFEGTMTRIWGEVFSPLKGAAADAIAGVEHAFDDVKAWFAKWWPVLLPLALTLFLGPLGLAIGVLIDEIILHWHTLSSTTESVFSTIGDIVRTVFGPLALFIQLNWDAVVQVFRVGMAVIEAVLGVGWVLIQGTAESAWNVIRAFFEIWWVGVKTLFDVYVAVIGGALEVGWQAIQLVAETVWNTLKVFFQLWWDGFKLIVTVGWDLISGIFTVFLDLIEGKWGAAWDAIKQMFENIWSAIKADAESSWSAIRDYFSSEWAAFETFASSSWKAIEGAVVSAWSAVKSGVESVWTDIKSFLSTEWATFATTGKNLWQAVVNGITGVWDTLSGAASSMWDSVKAAFTSGINDAIGVLNLFIKAIDIIPGVSIKTIGLISSNSSSGPAGSRGTTAGLAGGGLVPIGAGFMTGGPVAVVGEGRPAFPEFVIPSDPQYAGNAQRLLAQAMLRIGVPGHSKGILGIASSVAGDVGGAIAGAAGAGLTDLAKIIGFAVDPVIDAAKSVATGALSGLPTPMRQLGDWVVDTLAGDAKSLFGKAKAKAQATQAAEAGSGGAGTAVGAIPTGSHLSLIAQALQLAGVAITTPNEQDVNLIVQYESGWNPNAINNSDINARMGDPSRGLMQTIGTTFEAYALPGYNSNIYDPLSNLIAGIRYAVSRYGGLGNVPGVIGVSQGRGYSGYASGGVLPFNMFDSGGTLPPGLSVAYNGTGGPEEVPNPQTTGQLTAAALQLLSVYQQQQATDVSAAGSAAALTSALGSMSQVAETAVAAFDLIASAATNMGAAAAAAGTDAGAAASTLGSFASAIRSAVSAAQSSVSAGVTSTTTTPPTGVTRTEPTIPGWPGSPSSPGFLNPLAAAALPAGFSQVLNGPGSAGTAQAAGSSGVSVAAGAVQVVLQVASDIPDSTISKLGAVAHASASAAMNDLVSEVGIYLKGRPR